MVGAECDTYIGAQHEWYGEIKYSICVAVRADMFSRVHGNSCLLD